MTTERLRRMRRIAPMLALALLALGCGGGDDTPEEPSAADEAPAENGGDTEDEEPAGGTDERPELYYPASELFLPDHQVDGYIVDFYASHDDIDATIAWFEDNLDDLDEFDVQDEMVNAHRLWIIDRPDAAPGDVTRIEIAVSSAHADIGFMAQVSDVVPPDTVIIGIARA
ncbi:MAG: hypothetical protein WD011_08765 [Nitriliruptoraceae bacterium]